MNKLIPSIVVSAALLSPLCTTVAAFAHHTSSHVSTVSVNSTVANKKKTTELKQAKPATKATAATSNTVNQKK